MAASGSGKLSTAAFGFGYLPVPRQVGILIGVAASIALAIYVVMWSQDPNFRPLYTNLASGEASSIVDALHQSGIPYKMNNKDGTILVPSAKVFEARMKLAADGLPGSSRHGFELLNKNSSFGTSQFMETARYRHAIEGELAKTISSFKNVKTARVHLAIPKRSVFARNKSKASASVFVHNYSGRRLTRTQVASIIHIVASSIPSLNADNVTVVDQQGKLLSGGGGNDNIAIANKQFAYVTQMEADYAKKIENIITPILGPNKVRARVTANVDFTRTQQTREHFNPDMVSLRSEQSYAEGAGGSNSVSGVPGALSNKPSGRKSSNTKTASGDNMRQQYTKNYELDKTISHVQMQPVKLKRLSVAVVVDDKTKVNPRSKKLTSTPLSADELQQLTTLVKDAVGFNPQRGDTISVVNRAFARPAPAEELPPMSITEMPWFWTLVKQILGGIFVLLIVFAVLRPLLKGLTEKTIELKPMLEQYAQPQQQQTEQQQRGLPYEQQIGVVKSMASEDPKRVAQVMKTWVSDE